MARVGEIISERQRQAAQQAAGSSIRIGGPPPAEEDRGAYIQEPADLTPEPGMLPQYPEDMRPQDSDPNGRPVNLDAERESQLASPRAARITEKDIPRFEQVLRKYQAAKTETTERIKRAETWWRGENTYAERKNTQIGKDGGFTAKSGWLRNLIISKQADAMANFPEPVLLPREEDDQEQARRLSKIIPCVLERNNFEKTYDSAQWQKGKTGTGLYKVFWDATKEHGLGDIAVEKINLLNVFTEPGVADIQKSEYLYHVEEVNRERLKRDYPGITERLSTAESGTDQFAEQAKRDSSDYVRVVEVYYHKGDRLHYCKYITGAILESTENSSELSERGLYDHGLYPFVFDPLLPVENSPYGYGYVDLAENPQTYIDLLKTAMLKNAMVGTMPRFFMHDNEGINEQQFLDLSNPIVRVPGSLDANNIKDIPYRSLDGNYINILNETISELRETSGNTESANGVASGGVTAASGIAALQEAAGKTSRLATMGSYRAYGEIVNLCIELIRQFYDLPRQFQIIGKSGAEEYIEFQRAEIAEREIGVDAEGQTQYRLPVFDIKIRAQKKNTYARVAQNELAIQFYGMGIFDPQNVDKALMMLEMMDFDGKDELRQKLQRQGTLYDKMLDYMQIALGYAMQHDTPERVQQLSQDIMMATGGSGAVMAPAKLPTVAGEDKQESSITQNAREQANAAAEVGGGRAIAERGTAG